MRAITLALSISLLASNVMADNFSFKKQIIRSISTQDDPAFLACMKMSKKEGDRIKNEILKSCIEPLPDSFIPDQESTEKLNNCTTTILQKNGVDKAKLDACEEESDDNSDEIERDPNYDWRADISQERIDSMLKDGLTIQNIEDVITEQHYRKVESKEMVDLMKQATKTGTRLNEVTLPIYEPNELGVHYADEQIFEGVKFLPVLTITIKGTPEQAIAFYKKQLPSFEVDPTNSNRLVEKITTSKKPFPYAQIPNVNVLDVNGETLIQLYYRP